MSELHSHDKNCRYCDGCGKCLYDAGFKQDTEAAIAHGFPIFVCNGCGQRNWLD